MAKKVGIDTSNWVDVKPSLSSVDTSNWTPVQEKVVITKPGYDPLKLTPEEEKLKAVGEVVDSLDFYNGYNDDEKKYLIELAKRPDVNYDTWNEAKKTMGGESKKQQSTGVLFANQHYYIDSKTNLPVPLGLGQKPPKGQQIASVWGSQEAAEDDSWLTTIGKNLANTIPAIVDNFASIPVLAYGLATGKEAEWYRDLSTELEAFSFQRSSASKQGFLDITGIESKEDLTKLNEDILNPKNWNFNADNIAGTISSLASSVIQFWVGGEAVKAVGLGAKAINAVRGAESVGATASLGARLASKSPFFIGSYMTNLGESLEAADEAGVKERDKYVVASIATIPVSLIDVGMGVTAKLINNPAMQAEKKAMIKALIKGWKQEGGELTKESLDKLYKTATVGGSAVLGKWGKEAAKTSISEASEEVMQQFIQNASQQIYDNMYAENKKVGEGRYGTTIDSPEALVEYINSAIAGGIGGAVGGASIDKYRRSKAEAQSENIYGYLKRGEEGVVALKAQVGTALKTGNISQGEYETAIHKIDTYNKYFSQTKDLNLNDKDNRRIFDLTWSNENLKTQMEELNKNPDAKIKGTIVHRRLLDTEAILEANSKEMSDLMTRNIADQQTAVSETVEDKLKKKEAKAAEQAEKPTPEQEFIQQIRAAETEKDLDSYLKEADEKNITTPSIIDAISKKRTSLLNKERKNLRNEPLNTFINKKFGEKKDFNNLINYSTSKKVDAIVEHLEEGGNRTITGGKLELGQWAGKIANGKKLPFYYDVDFDGKRFRLASSDYTNKIKQQNLVGKEVAVDLVLPTDSNLEELKSKGLLDDYNVVQRTNEKGELENSFVFKDDVHKQRYPFILVARTKNKKTGQWEKVANLATNDFSAVSGKVKNREGLRRPLPQNFSGEVQIEQLAPETKGDVGFDKSTAELDYEAQAAQLELVAKIDLGEERKVEEPLASTKSEKIEEKRNLKDEKDVKALLADFSIEKQKYIIDKIIDLQLDEDAQYDKSFISFYVKYYGKQYETEVKPIETARSEADTKGGKETGADSTKRIRRTGIPKSKQKIKDKRYLSALKQDVDNAYDLVMQYFIGGGKITNNVIKELFKSPEGEKRARLGLLNKTLGRDLEELANFLWEQDDRFDTREYKNAIEQVVQQNNTASEMADKINSKYNVENNLSEEDIAYYNELDKSPLSDEAAQIVDELTDEEKLDILGENPIEPKDKLDDEEGGIVDFDEDVPFQKRSKLEQDTIKQFEKKLELLKKAIPGIDVVMDSDIKGAGQLDADGKTIRLNPNYNRADTPIHEFGHALIDMLGGINNSIVKKGIAQLKDTALWNETKQAYPELNEDMLAKEVLAEAIGREGAKIFDTKEKQSKFASWLSGLFYKLKQLLGIDKNVAKKLANQLLAGNKIEGTIKASGVTQEQKVKSFSEIENVKLQSYKSWSRENGSDIESLEARLEELKDEEQTEEVRQEIAYVENSIEIDKELYDEYVDDRKAIIDFVKSKGDVADMTLDELNEIQVALSKYDDIVKSGAYKDLLYNIGMKANELQMENLKAAVPEYDIEKDYKGDLSKADIWSQGLSTIGDKFPAIQLFYKKYRDAHGKMSQEISSIQQKGLTLAKAVIKEYHKEHGVGERLKHLFVKGGNKYFAFMAKDGALIEKGSKEYRNLSKAQKDLLDFVSEQKAELDKHMEADKNILLKSGAGFIETFQKSGLFQAYANYITKNYNLRNVKVKFKNPKTGATTDEYFGDVEQILKDYSQEGIVSKAQSIFLLTKYNLQAKNNLNKRVHSDGELIDKKTAKGKYFLAPDGKLVSMFGGDYKGDFTENYYETFMKYAQDAVFSKNMSPLMPTLRGIEMFYKSMGSKAENVSKFLDVVKKGKFLGETRESGLGEAGDAVLRTLRKWTSWRFIAFNIPANIWNVAVGEYNQFRSDGGKAYIKGKKRFVGSMLKGRKNAKAFNILKKYAPDIVTDINRIDPEKHIGRFFDLFAFGGQKLGEGLIRGSAIVGKLSTEHYNWLDNQGNVKGDTKQQRAAREKIIKKEIDKYISEVERVQGRYSDVEKRNFAYFELGQFFGQFKVWMPEWMSDRFANTYIDADGVKRQGSFRTLWSYGFKDFMRDASTKAFYISNDPKHVAARKQLRGMIATSGLILAYLSASDDDEDKDLANQLDKALQNISSVYRMDNNTFLISQPAAAMATAKDLGVLLNEIVTAKTVKSGKDKGSFKAVKTLFNLTPANKIIKTPIDILSED